MKKEFVFFVATMFVLINYLPIHSYGKEEVSIQITRPYAHVYVFDREIAPIPVHANRAFKAIVIGWVTVNVNGDGLNKVEFYVDDKLKYNDSEEPYEWLWDEKMVHPPKHELKVIGYGGGGEAEDSINVLYLNPFSHGKP